MHYTALLSGKSFSETYGNAGKIVVDIGGQDIEGGCSLRSFFTDKGMEFISVDIYPNPPALKP